MYPSRWTACKIRPSRPRHPSPPPRAHPSRIATPAAADLIDRDDHYRPSILRRLPDVYDGHICAGFIDVRDRHWESSQEHADTFSPNSPRTSSRSHPSQPSETIQCRRSAATYCLATCRHPLRNMPSPRRYSALLDALEEISLNAGIFAPPLFTCADRDTFSTLSGNRRATPLVPFFMRFQPADMQTSPAVIGGWHRCTQAPPPPHPPRTFGR